MFRHGIYRPDNPHGACLQAALGLEAFANHFNLGVLELRGDVACEPLYGVGVGIEVAAYEQPGEPGLAACRCRGGGMAPAHSSFRIMGMMASASLP